MLCSICIATFKRPKLLDKLLESLVTQNIRSDLNLEIIVVDNDNNKSAELILKNYIDQYNIIFKYLIEPIKNISLARNKGVANAKGEYILFIDDDEIASPNWININAGNY